GAVLPLAEVEDAGAWRNVGLDPATGLDRCADAEAVIPADAHRPPQHEQRERGPGPARPGGDGVPAWEPGVREAPPELSPAVRHEEAQGCRRRDHEVSAIGTPHERADVNDD